MGVTGKEVFLSGFVPGASMWLLASLDSEVSPELAATFGLGMGALGLLAIPFFLAMSRNTR